MSCTCTKVPIENKAKNSKVTSYTTDGSCPFCVSQREANAILAEEQRLELEANILIAERTRDNVAAELEAEGKIEKKNGKWKVK